WLPVVFFELSVGRLFLRHLLPAWWCSFVFYSGERVRRAASTTFTASEALAAILHHRATSGNSSQLAVFQDVKRSGLDDSSCIAPSINVVVVSGDSIAFQVFRRLLRLIRDGVSAPVTIDVGNKKLTTTALARPNFGFGKWDDIVLAIYPTHDELFNFRSLMPPEVVMGGKRFERETTPTMNSFFVNAAQRRRSRFCNGSSDNTQTVAKLGSEGEEGEALFYVIFLWDPLTTRPRRDALASEYGPVAVGQEPFKFDRIVPSILEAVKSGMTLEPPVPVIPLRRLGVNIGLHVQAMSNWESQASASFESTLTYMATGCAPPPRSSGRADQLERKNVDPPLGGTALYRLSPVLSVPPNERQLFTNVARAVRRDHAQLPRGGAADNKQWRRALKIASKQSRFFQVDRTVSLFTWLNATEKRRRSFRRGTRPETPPHYFSSVRVLDIQKAFLMLSNVSGINTGVFEREGVHETCATFFPWFGVTTGWRATAKDFTSSQSGDILKSIEPLKHLLNSISASPNFKWMSFAPAFRGVDGCGDFGTHLTITAMLADIVAGGALE
ncbi:Hypothetical protein, putative, partial [Bodo saltans]